MKRIYVILVLIFGIAVGLLINNLKSPITKIKFNEKLIIQGQNMLNPLLKYTKFKEYRPFRHKIEELIQREKQNNKALYIAVYFCSLPDGTWFGIDEREKFSPGSLLKVPIMMIYLKRAESDPDILKKKLKLENDVSVLSQNIKPSEEIKPGEVYTVDDLIYRMIAYSDNKAAVVLADNIGKDVYYKGLEELGIYIPGVDESKDYMSLKLYINLFRMLYNCTFLNRDMSLKALSYLTKVEFKSGFIAGIPAGVLVAHKFGEVDFPNGLKQLHETGIIYCKDTPYMLGVMTRGNDFSKLANVIKEISALIYNEVQK